jgi:transposase-like protein
MLQAGLQDLINAKVTAKIGAGSHERTSERVTRRNGSRPKTLATPLGEVDLQIPKLREGSFFPSLLSPRRRDDKALDAVICQAWIDGVSTRKVDQLVRALGKDTGISRSTVSRICSEIDEAVQEFLTRRVAHTWFPSLFLDATDLDVRHRGRVVPQALVVATDADPEGVALVTSDAHAGSVGDFVCGGFGVICAAWAAREEKMSHAMNTDTTITMEDGGRVDMRSGSFLHRLTWRRSLTSWSRPPGSRASI